MLSKPLIDCIRQQYRLSWDGLHGASHWSRVRINGLQLARHTGADPVVVELFAFLHDSCRHDDGLDPHHGPRAASFIGELSPHLLPISDWQKQQLLVAVIGHTVGTHHADATVATCWDADRLDLWRVGIRPCPSRLLTAPARCPDTIRQASKRAQAWLDKRWLI